jgi:hypothetical protein
MSRSGYSDGNVNEVRVTKGACRYRLPWYRRALMWWIGRSHISKPMAMSVLSLPPKFSKPIPKDPLVRFSIWSNETKHDRH